MKQETITISKKEYARLKNLEKIDWELVGKFKEGLKELKAGKIKKVR